LDLSACNNNLLAVRADAPPPYFPLMDSSMDEVSEYRRNAYAADSLASQIGGWEKKYGKGLRAKPKRGRHRGGRLNQEDGALACDGRRGQATALTSAAGRASGLVLAGA